MSKTTSERILATPSSYTKKHYLYVQEIGTLKSLEPHISHREKLDSFLFFIVTEGSGTVTFHNTTFPIREGDCVWLCCQDPYFHESSVEDPWTLMWVHFNGAQAQDFYELYREKEGAVAYTPAALTPYTDCLQELYRLQQQKDSLSDLLSHRQLTDLMAQIFYDSFHGSTRSAIPEKFMAVNHYLEQHYAEKITLDELSERFFLSKYHLLREYQRFFGTTIQNDLTVKRLSHAKSMLRFSQESVENIALLCGFQTSSYFIKVFKRFESLTPLEYRKKW